MPVTGEYRAFVEYQAFVAKGLKITAADLARELLKKFGEKVSFWDFCLLLNLFRRLVVLPQSNITFVAYGNKMSRSNIQNAFRSR
jgi:hypothetical protein